MKNDKVLKEDKLLLPCRMVIMSHLSDVQEEIRMNSSMIDRAQNRIKFVKFLLIQHGNKALTELIDPDGIYKEYCKVYPNNQIQ